MRLEKYTPISAASDNDGGLRSPAAEGRGAGDPAGHAAEKVRVLVVDDNREFARCCARLLQMGGFEVEIAYDGTTGLEAAVAFRPSFTLLDIGLPDLDGFEVARRLRSESTLSAMTLIAVTAYSHDEARRQATASGFDHYLVKPMTYADLGPLLTPAPARAPA